MTKVTEWKMEYAALPARLIPNWTYFSIQLSYISAAFLETVLFDKEKKNTPQIAPTCKFINSTLFLFSESDGRVLLVGKKINFIY